MTELCIVSTLMQANKYNVLDQNGQTVALIAEDVTGIGNAIGRQVLRTRRNFTATVFNADGMHLKDGKRCMLWSINIFHTQYKFLCM